MDYEVKESSRARRLKLAVHRDGRVVVTVPSRRFSFSVEKFVADHADWIQEQQKRAQKLGPLVELNGSAADFKKNKNIALEFVTKKVEEMNRYYNFSYKKISVRNARGRWGSCTNGGALSFNYRLVKIPVELAEYVVAHELAHLAEHNHGPKFWKLVSETIPDYKERRKNLRKFLL